MFKTPILIRFTHILYRMLYDKLLTKIELDNMNACHLVNYLANKRNYMFKSKGCFLHQSLTRTNNQNHHKNSWRCELNN